MKKKKITSDMSRGNDSCWQKNKAMGKKISARCRGDACASFKRTAGKKYAKK